MINGTPSLSIASLLPPCHADENLSLTICRGYLSLNFAVHPRLSPIHSPICPMSSALIPRWSTFLPGATRTVAVPLTAWHEGEFRTIPR